MSAGLQRGPGRVVLGVLGLLGVAAILPAAGCRNRPPGCEHESVERCRWERGVAPPEDAAQGPGDGAAVDGEGGGVQRGPLDDALADIVEFMGVGLEWPLVDERARELCGAAPQTPEGEAAEDDAEAWYCEPAEALQINGQPLLLEAGGGVVSLTAIEVDGAQSAEILEFARTRFDDWCERDFFVALEAQVHEEFWRCALPEGPYLLVGRFPRELAEDRWQVSIAVMDAG